jgi:phosphoribosyl 1,2-cyclic phosphodiesterase
MKATLWGTRGSQAAPGPDTVRYGGNTSCVEVEVVPDARIVLDAGTGLRRLGDALPPEVRRVDVLLTHLHMDHIQGLGFFAPLFEPGFEVHLWGPGTAEHDLASRLTRYMSPPLFPVRLGELPCALSVHDVHDGVEIPDVAVSWSLVCHPGPTIGYRIEHDGRTLAYLPDHEPQLACRDFAHRPEWCSGFEVARDADLLLHDAQFSEAEYEERVGWGHSTLRHALAFAHVTGVKRLLPFHHDPAHPDDLLDSWFADADAAATDGFELLVAREGDSVTV